MPKVRIPPSERISKEIMEIIQNLTDHDNNQKLLGQLMQLSMRKLVHRRESLAYAALSHCYSIPDRVGPAPGGPNPGFFRDLFYTFWQKRSPNPCKWDWGFGMSRIRGVLGHYNLSLKPITFHLIFQHPGGGPGGTRNL
jgi:hypothetical protein